MYSLPQHVRNVGMGISDSPKPNVDKMENEKDVDGLTKALKDERGNIRREAAIALGRIGDTMAVEPLIQALKDEHGYVRREAAYALGIIRDARAVESLIQALKDEDSYVRSDAAEALANMGKPAVEPLTKALKDGDSRVRDAAKEALEKIMPRPLPPPPAPVRQPAVSPEITSSEKVRGESDVSEQESAWEERYRFLSSVRLGGGCPFRNSMNQCVSPAAEYPIVACTAQRLGHQSCFVYPILIQKLPIWMTDYRSRMQLEADMEGPPGKCKTCGRNRKLDKNGMCSVCILAARRADRVFDETKKQSLSCDNCESKITRGEAFMPLEVGELRCVNCWKRYAD